MSDDGTLDLGDVEVDDFAAFWRVFPRHKDRARAQMSYRRARRVASAEVILDAARRYAIDVAGKPVTEIRWAVEWLRAEPWRSAATSQPARPVPHRRRRDPSKPRRAPQRTAPVRLTVQESKEKWLREHGVTEAEYETRKEDREWVERVKRRGIVE